MRTHLPRVLVLAFTLAFLSSFARADRPAIEAVLADMSRAAAAADADTYLSSVSTTDPLFYKEQCNWAKDLNRIKPTSVAFSIFDADKDDDKRPEFAEKRARFEMLTTWTLPATKDDDKPSDHSVSFPVIFTLGDSGKWLYAGEDWQVLETAEFPVRDERFQGVDPASARQPINMRVARPQHGARVKFFPGYETVAERIVAVLPLVREHVDEGFQSVVPRVQEVKIYPSMKHLQESIYLSYTDGLSGWNEPGESIKLLTRPTASTRGLRTLLAHEYGHVATFELGPKANDMPWWLLEGIAELSAERFTGKGKGADAEASVIRWQKNDTLAPWQDLADFHSVPPNLTHHVYKQGHHMLMFVSDAFGQDARNKWMREMAGGKTLDEATIAAMHMPFSELDAKWREAVKALVDKAAEEKAAKQD